MNYISLQNSVQNNFIKTHNPFHISPDTQETKFVNEAEQNLTENNNQIPSETCHKIQEVWSKRNFERPKHILDMKKVTVEHVIDLSNVKTTWASSAEVANYDFAIEGPTSASIPNNFDQNGSSPEAYRPIEKELDKDEPQSPSHHARRPPNAFLIFCKKHRPVVRQRFPNTENRGVTKILGEWWALLSAQEKQVYNDLAKEYKDAFLSANPDFRWYKLPAPPLRTLAPRPVTTTVIKVPTPLTSPTNTLSEFTPGKLADESQLGGLTSLMNNNFSCSTTPKIEDCCKVDRETNNNINNEKTFESTTTSSVQPSLPPKSIKNPIFETYNSEQNSGENVMTTQDCKNKNMTNQEFFDKVVDDIFSKQIDKNGNNNNFKEQRKSDRMCKGKRYERFMAEGRLVGVKRDPKSTQFGQQKFTKTFHKTESDQKPEIPKLDLENTIKRLAERTNVKLDYDTIKKSDKDEKIVPNERVRSISENHCSAEKSRDRTLSESSDMTASRNPGPNFNLDLRIGNLPCLSYDEFLFRKKQSKKRKIKSKYDEERNTKIQKLESTLDTSEGQLVGSKKRKNKQSITHLNKNEENVCSEDVDLIGLATLAMVAASTEKIEEKLLA